MEIFGLKGLMTNLFHLKFGQAEAETLSLQQEIFADLEKICPPHCILTSNSLTFSSKSIGEKTKCDDRMAGIHFFW